jgi:hypothetical protein
MKAKPVVLCVLASAHFGCLVVPSLYSKLEYPPLSYWRLACSSHTLHVKTSSRMGS